MLIEPDAPFLVWMVRIRNKPEPPASPNIDDQAVPVCIRTGPPVPPPVSFPGIFHSTARPPRIIISPPVASVLAPAVNLTSPAPAMSLLVNEVAGTPSPVRITTSPVKELFAVDFPVSTTILPPVELPDKTVMVILADARSRTFDSMVSIHTRPPVLSSATPPCM